MREKRVPEAAETVIRERCRKFTVLLLEEIKHCLRENFAILKKINTLSARHALTPSKPSIVELDEAFVTSAEEIGKIERQWQNLPYVHWQNVDNTEKLWTEVHLYNHTAGDNPFKELCNLALTMLALPYSNADVERVFSQLNIVKKQTPKSSVSRNCELHPSHKIWTFGLRKIL